jgi:hypothetical protein
MFAYVRFTTEILTEDANQGVFCVRWASDVKLKILSTDLDWNGLANGLVVRREGW